MCVGAWSCDTVHTTEELHIPLTPTSPSDPSQLVLYIGDFAGQDVYHNTHSIMFKPRGVYVVVVDPTRHHDECEREAERQCANIHAVAPAAPIVCVQTHGDDYGGGPCVDVTKLEGRYDSAWWGRT